jgi:hypothetical protein
MIPSRRPVAMIRFAKAPRAVVLPEPKKPPAKINFTGCLTRNFLGDFMVQSPMT